LPECAAGGHRRSGCGVPHTTPLQLPAATWSV
jgi:hypothetical protein